MRPNLLIIVLASNLALLTHAGRLTAPASAPLQSEIRNSHKSQVSNVHAHLGALAPSPGTLPKPQTQQQNAVPPKAFKHSQTAPAPRLVTPQKDGPAPSDPISELLDAIPLFVKPLPALDETQASQQSKKDTTTPRKQTQQQDTSSRSAAGGATQSFQSRPLQAFQLPPLPFPSLFENPFERLANSGSTPKDATTSLRQAPRDENSSEASSDLPPLFEQPPDLIEALYARDPDQAIKTQVHLPDPLPLPDAVLEAAADGDPFPLPNLDEEDSAPDPTPTAAPAKQVVSQRASNRLASRKNLAGDPNRSQSGSAVPTTRAAKAEGAGVTSLQSLGGGGGLLPSLPNPFGLPSIGGRLPIPGGQDGGVQFPNNVLPGFPRFPTVPRFTPLSLFPGMDSDDDGGDLEPIGRRSSSSSGSPRDYRRMSDEETSSGSTTASTAPPSFKQAPTRIRVVRRVNRHISAGAPSLAASAVPASAPQAPHRAGSPMPAAATQSLVPHAHAVGTGAPAGAVEAVTPLVEFAGGAQKETTSSQGAPGPSPGTLAGTAGGTSFRQVDQEEGVEDRDLLAALGMSQSLLQVPTETAPADMTADAAQAALGETLSDVLGEALLEGITLAGAPGPGVAKPSQQSPSGAASAPASSLEAKPQVTAATPLQNLSLQEKRSKDVPSHPSWAGQAIPKKVEKSGTDSDITSNADLEGLSQERLMGIFSNGVPDIPSALPGSQGTYTVCTGEALAPGSVQTGAPTELNDGLRSAVRALWTGKVLHTSAETNGTTVWNLLYTNNSVAVVGLISKMDPGLSEDGRPSAVVDYSSNENVLLRAVRDELRRVGPNMWLGRGWLTSASSGSPINAPANSQALQLRSAAQSLSSGLSIPIPGTADAAAGGEGGHPELGEKVPTVFFGLQCQDMSTPRLTYTPLAQLQAGANRVTGMNSNFALPAINSTSSLGANPQEDGPQVDPSTLGAFASLSNPLGALGTIFGNISSGSGLPAQQISLPALTLPTNGDNLRTAASNVIASAASALPGARGQASTQAAPTGPAEGSSGPPAGPNGGVPRPTVAPIMNPVAALMDDPLAAGSSNLAAGLLSAVVQGRPFGASVPPVASVVSAVTGNPQAGAVAADMMAGLTPVAGQLTRDGLSEAREALQAAVMDEAP
eukprot:jgi/Botrbrau1/13078/Bobra.0187s0040.1